MIIVMRTHMYALVSRTTRSTRVVGFSFLFLLSVTVVSSAAAAIPTKASATMLLANADLQNRLRSEDNRVFIPSNTSSGNIIPNSTVPNDESGRVYIPGPVSTNTTSPLISNKVYIPSSGNSSQNTDIEITRSALKASLAGSSTSNKEPFVLPTPFLSQTTSYAATKSSTLGTLAQSNINNNNNNNSTNALQLSGYNRGISYNLGYSQGVKNADNDWNSSNQDIHAFTYDCPSGHTKDFCNGYTDGYSDKANDLTANRKTD